MCIAWEPWDVTSYYCGPSRVSFPWRLRVVGGTFYSEYMFFVVARLSSLERMCYHRRGLVLSMYVAGLCRILYQNIVNVRAVWRQKRAFFCQLRIRTILRRVLCWDIVIEILLGGSCHLTTVRACYRYRSVVVQFRAVFATPTITGFLETRRAG